jgi:HEAT repeat protein
MGLLVLLVPAVVGAAQAHGKPAVAPALRSWLMAFEAVPHAGQIRQAGGAEVVAVLQRVARDRGEATYARQRAASFLGLLGEPTATAALRDLLRAGDPAVRPTAVLAWAMGPARKGELGAQGELHALLADPLPTVRTAAARGLEFAADRPTALAHVKARRGREQHPEVKAALAHALQQLGDARD